MSNTKKQFIPSPDDNILVRLADGTYKVFKRKDLEKELMKN